MYGFSFRRRFLDGNACSVPRRILYRIRIDVLQTDEYAVDATFKAVRYIEEKEHPNAIILHVCRTSYSWKKYPAFLTADEYQIFSALKVRTAMLVFDESLIDKLRNFGIASSPKHSGCEIT